MMPPHPSQRTCPRLRGAGLLRSERASSVLEVALMLPVFVFLLVGAIDFGRGYYFAIEVSAAAEAGAMYGALNPTDATGMVAAAKLDAKDVSGLAATAAYGCECSDGSSAIANCASVPTCTYNVVNYVEVDTSATYTPILKYPGIASSFALKGKDRMRSGR